MLKELLKAERVRLTAFLDRDIELLKSWYGDSEFLRYYDYTPGFPKSAGQLTEMISEIKNSNDKYIFAIRNIQSDELIGVCGFENILWNNGTATVYIGLGNREYRGKGFAREALQLILEFAFMELNLHKLQLSVISYNNAAITLYEKAGFIKEGTLREFVYRDNIRYDLFCYGLLRREWLKL